MHKLAKTPLAWTGAVLVFAIALTVIAALALRAQRPRSFLGGAPPGVSLVCLGPATNYLRLDHSQTWQAFSLSNGSSHRLFYTVTAVDLQSAGGWLSNSPAATGLMTRRETPGEIAPGGSDVFYASIPGSSVPWRLRVGCFEQAWLDPMDRSLSRFLAKARGLPAPTGKSWSGRRYELVASEIKP
jgi:hypothetical protein